MIRIARSLVFLTLVGGAALSLSACKQGLNNRCQVNSDCESDLICVLPVGGTPQSGGVCLTTSGQDMASGQDFSATGDLSGANLSSAD